VAAENVSSWAQYAEVATAPMFRFGVTNRGPWILSRRYGFPSFQAFLDSIPSGARVLDAGAGNSSFMERVATERPDVTCVALDIGYPAGEQLYEDLPNLRKVGADLTKLHASAIADSSFQLITSYGALVHLMNKKLEDCLDPSSDISKAATSILEMLAPDGIFRFGKVKPVPQRRSWLHRSAEIAYTPPGHHRQAAIRKIVELTPRYGLRDT